MKKHDPFLLLLGCILAALCGFGISLFAALLLVGISIIPEHSFGWVFFLIGLACTCIAYRTVIPFARSV